MSLEGGELLRGEVVEEVPAHALDVHGRGGFERGEALVGEHGELTAPIGGARLAAHPAQLLEPATACDSRLRDDWVASASSLMRRRRPGVSESITRIS